MNKWHLPCDIVECHWSTNVAMQSKEVSKTNLLCSPVDLQRSQEKEHLTPNAKQQDRPGKFVQQGIVVAERWTSEENDQFVIE
eukprot:c10330_g1_i1 orf=1-246(-)